uniref:Alanine--glyoxylate aminotransferase 2, mitochondrial n=1 Tax=Callorhinchus milii TaxID=7868 RepID=V9KPN0_CALMI
MWLRLGSVWRSVAAVPRGHIRSAGIAPVHTEVPEAPDLPPCDVTPEPYQGLAYEQVLAIRREQLRHLGLTFYREPLLMYRGHRQWLWAADGSRFLDFFGGIVTVSVGHSHPRVLEAMRRQTETLAHTTSIYMTSAVHQYVQRLSRLFPQPLSVVFLVNSGSEANDLAMLLARVHTGNFDLITLRGGYHGGVSSTMGLTSIGSWKFNVAHGFGCHATMCPDVYRGPWGGSHCRDSPIQALRQCTCPPGGCEAGDRYVEDLRDVLQCSVSKHLAAIIAEPIQGVGGVVQYPRGFLQAASELVRERGGLYISDEVQTGFGRLGSHYWGFQAHGVTPDIVTMAKGIGNGFPMAAVVTTPEVAESFSEALHFNTFGGNPVAGAVGTAVLDVIEDEGLQMNSECLGKRMMEGLAVLRDQYEIVGDVRGKGLMIGMEMVRDKGRREPLVMAEVNEIWEDCRQMGLLVGKGGLYNQTFRITPPMCITEADVDFALSVFHVALHRHSVRKGTA